MSLRIDKTPAALGEIGAFIGEGSFRAEASFKGQSARISRYCMSFAKGSSLRSAAFLWP